MLTYRIEHPASDLEKQIRVFEKDVYENLCTKRLVAHLDAGEGIVVIRQVVLDVGFNTQDELFAYLKELTNKHFPGNTGMTFSSDSNTYQVTVFTDVTTDEFRQQRHALHSEVEEYNKNLYCVLAVSRRRS